MNLILCGLPKSGKTTIGKLLASELKSKFIDTDSLIEESYRLQTGEVWTCRLIFQERGEMFFRELEKQQIATLLNLQKHVIAIGGGTLQSPENRAHLQSIGKIIYLKSEIEVLWQRNQLSGVPSILDKLEPKKSFYELAEKRIPVYVQVSQLTIDTTHFNQNAIVQAILTGLNTSTQ